MLLQKVNKFISEASGVIPEKLLITIDNIYEFQKKWINDFIVRILTDQWVGDKTELAKKFKHMNFDHFMAKKVRNYDKIGIFNNESGYYESDFEKFNDEQFKISEAVMIRVRIIIDYNNSFSGYNKEGIKVDQLFDRETKTSQITIYYKSPVIIKKGISNEDLEKLAIFLNNSIFKSRVLLNRELLKNIDLYFKYKEAIVKDYIQTTPNSLSEDVNLQNFLYLLDSSQPQNINAMVSSTYSEIEFDKNRRTSIRDTEAFMLSQVLKTFNADNFLRKIKIKPDELKTSILTICKSIMNVEGVVTTHDADYKSKPKTPFVSKKITSSNYTSNGYKKIVEPFLHKKKNLDSEKFNLLFFKKFEKLFNSLGLKMERKIYKIVSHPNFSLQDRNIKAEKLAKIIVTGIISTINNKGIKPLTDYIGGNKKTPYIFLNFKKMGFLNEFNVYFMREDLRKNFSYKLNINDIVIAHDLTSFNFEEIEDKGSKLPIDKKFKKWVAAIKKGWKKYPEKVFFSNYYTPNPKLSFEENLEHELNSKQLIVAISNQIKKIDLERRLDFDYIFAKKTDKNPKTKWGLMPPTQRYNKEQFNDYYKRWYADLIKRLKSQNIDPKEYFKRARDKYYHNNKEEIAHRKLKREEDYITRQARKSQNQN